MRCRAQRKEEIAAEIESANAADEHVATAELYDFRAVYVFDVEQAGGKDLPEISTALSSAASDLSSSRDLDMRPPEAKTAAPYMDVQTFGDIAIATFHLEDSLDFSIDGKSC